MKAHTPNRTGNSGLEANGIMRHLRQSGPSRHCAPAGNGCESSSSRECRRLIEDDRLNRGWGALLVFALAFLLLRPAALAWQESAGQPAPNRRPGAPSAQSGAEPAPAVPADPQRFIIQADDVLDVVVFDEPQLSCQCVVSSAGTITLPLLKSVKAAGLTPNQLSNDLAQDLQRAGLLSHPDVTVSVRSAPSSVVSVEGGVKSPGPVTVTDQTKLSFVITQAGGLTDDAGDKATVYRGSLGFRDSKSGEPASARKLVVDLKSLLDGTDPSQNIPLFPGDRVLVDRAGLFYVLGEVNRPGGYNLKSAQEQMTVLGALATAGDITSIAKKQKAYILRKNLAASGGREQINVDLSAILTRRAPDEQLRVDDVLYVPASGRKRALRGLSTTGQAIVAPTTTGLIIYRR